MAAMKMIGVFSILRNDSCASSAVMTRERVVPDAKALTSAPAEKNFSEALVITTAWMSSSARTSSTALANERRKA